MMAFIPFPRVCYILVVVTQQKVTEWEITKTEVGNEMEIFITLNKYNTRQQREEGTPWIGDDLVSKNTPPQ